MTQAQSVALKPPPPRRRARRILRAVVTLLIVLAVCAAIFFLLPTWACTRQGRRFVLHRINNRIHGKLTAQYWRVGWFSGMTVRGLALRNAQGRVVLRCSDLHTDLTLWSVLWGNYDCGTTRLDAVTLSLRRHADGTNSLDRIVAGPSPAHPLPGAAVRGAAGHTAIKPASGAEGPSSGELSRFLRPLLRTLRGVIEIHRSEIFLSAANGLPPIRLGQVGGRIEIATPSAPLRISLQGESLSPTGTAPCFVSGDFPPASRWTADPFALLGDVRVEAADIPSAALATWLGRSENWSLAIGPLLTRVTLSGRKEHVRPGARQLAVLDVAVDLIGTRGSVSAKARVFPTSGRGARQGYGDPIISISGRDGGYGQLNLATAGPTVHLLEYINPVMRGVLPTGTMQLAVRRLRARPGRWRRMRGTATVDLSGIRVRRGGLLDTLEGLADTPVPPTFNSIGLDVAPLRLRVARGRVRADECDMATGGGQFFHFRGSVGFDHSVRLVVRVPLASGVLGSAAMQTPISGTIRRPVAAARPKWTRSARKGR